MSQLNMDSHCSSFSSNKTMAQIDSIHLCDHYRCPLDILGEESCVQRRMEAAM